MRFVDRKKEMSRLQQLLKTDTPSFVIIRGRRRIGKSTLIGKVLNEGDVYYEADRTYLSRCREWQRGRWSDLWAMTQMVGKDSREGRKRKIRDKRR